MQTLRNSKKNIQVLTVASSSDVLCKSKELGSPRPKKLGLVFPGGGETICTKRLKPIDGLYPYGRLTLFKLG